jgi:hypothetical protein
MDQRMNVLQRVREARSQLKARGQSEHANADAIEELFARAQEIITEMNAKKLAAIREAEKPFLDELEQIDREMSMFITLSA